MVTAFLRTVRATTPATKLSLTLGFLSLSIVLIASALGLVPDADRNAGELRLRITESLGMRLWMTARLGDHDSLEPIVASFLDHYAEIRSLRIETSDGRMSFATPEHARLWPEESAAESVDRISVPLIDGEAVWGQLEVCYAPLTSGFLNPEMRLALFIGLVSVLSFRIYLHKILRYLDPSSVIPERVKTMLDTMSEGVLILDERERILLANSAFERFCGEDIEKLQGRNAVELKWAPSDPQDESVVIPWRTRETGDADANNAIRLTDATGTSRTLVVSVTPILGGDGRQRGTLATFDDVSAIERKNERLEEMVRELRSVRQQVEEQNEELRHIASRDALTGCLNRRALFERFENEWKSSQRYGHGVACIMLDLDRFKQINDTHGHAVGDQVLQRTVAVLERETRDTDVVGRYGGEEFCIVLLHSDIASAAAVGEKLCAAIRAQPMAGIEITASLGVSAEHLGASSPQELIDEADRALYAAKNSGRDRVARWDAMPVIEMPDAPPALLPAAADTATVAIPYHAVTALMSALAQRDDSTAAHSRRVADYCMLVAKDFMSAGDAFVLEIAAMLHDIGKIGVPDAVLLKPGPLTSEEWAIMERHDQIGIEIINSAFHSSELTAIVRNHHASFGDTARDPGLPTAHDIPLRARILTIADAYDAMTSDRVYRAGMPQADAFAELRRCAGTQFDPDLVEHFIRTVTAQDAGLVSDRPDESLEIMLGLGLATERLAAALESNDVSALSAMAGHLSAVAARHAWTDIAALADALDLASDADAEIADLLASSQDLLQVCQSTQSAYLEKRRAERSSPPTTA